MTLQLSRFFPILEWGRSYRGETLVNDGIAAVIVTVMLIPQSLMLFSAQVELSP